MLTEKQKQALRRSCDGFHPRGAEVRACRALEKLWLVTLRDDGPMGGSNGNWDGERWWAKITASGAAALEESEESEKEGSR